MAFLKIVISIGMMLLRGFIVSSVWGWFIVPLGVVAISIPEAIGLSCLVTLLHPPIIWDAKTFDGQDSQNLYLTNLIFGLMVLLATWFTAWIVHFIV